MVAWQRTNITQREERGIGPVSFPRLLIAGAALAVFALGFSRVVGFFGGCVSGILLAALVLVLTHPKDGMPLWSFLTRTTRGLATLAAIHGDQGTWKWVGTVLQVSPELGVLHADDVFEAEYTQDEEDPLPLLDDEITFLGHIEDINDRGFRIVPDPFTKFQRRKVLSPQPAELGGSD